MSGCHLPINNHPNKNCNCNVCLENRIFKLEIEELKLKKQLEEIRNERSNQDKFL